MTKFEAPRWLIDGPPDEEYKTYRMLGDIDSIRTLLHDGNMEQALDRCETVLDYIYVYDAIRVPSPINLYLPPHPEDEFAQELSEYTQPLGPMEDEDLTLSLVKQAIEMYEDVHREIRERWRQIEESLQLTYLRKQPMIIKGGYIFAATGKYCTVFKFTKSSTRVDDWTEFHMTEVDKVANRATEIKNWIEGLDEDLEMQALIKASCNSHTKMISELYTVLRSMIFFRIKKDYGLNS